MELYVVYSSTNGIELIGMYDTFDAAFRAMGEASIEDQGYLHIYKMPLNEPCKGEQVGSYSQGEVWEADDVL